MNRPAQRAAPRQAQRSPRAAGVFRLSLDTDEGEELPAFLRIARAIARDARAGRLRAGSRLPGSRELADSLGVHRNTVLAAYRELLAEGFLQTSAGRGTFIAQALPVVKPRRWHRQPSSTAAAPTRLAFEVEPAEPPPRSEVIPPGTIELYGGVSDARLVPRAALARAFRRAIRGSIGALGYGPPQGEPRLRDAIAQMLRATRGLSVEADDIVITRGSQMAIALIGQALIRPGQVVAVEGLGYRPAWRALQRSGARIAPVAIDEHGLRVDALAELCAREPIRAIYVTPHHQYPTTVTLSPGRRMELLALARAHRFAVIEDDYDHEFHYEGRPVLPLASADPGAVLYVGTLSKVLAPGLRVGYLVAPRAVREAVCAARFDLDRQGDRIAELALAELFEDGELQRHLWRTRRVYQDRRDHAVAQLRKQLGTWLELDVPRGGIALWTRVDKSLPVGAWHAEASKRGVLFQPGKLFTFDGRELQRARFGFAGANEREMTSAIAKLKDAALAARRGR